MPPSGIHRSSFLVTSSAADTIERGMHANTAPVCRPICHSLLLIVSLVGLAIRNMGDKAMAINDLILLSS